MNGPARAILFAIPVALAGVVLLVGRRSRRVHHQFDWRYRRRLVCLTVGLGQVRVYCSIVPEGTRSDPGFAYRVETRWPLFNPQRSPNDHAYWARAGFTYARGENTMTGTQYALASVPVWLLSAVLVLAAVGVGFWPRRG